MAHVHLVASKVVLNPVATQETIDTVGNGWNLVFGSANVHNEASRTEDVNLEREKRGVLIINVAQKGEQSKTKQTNQTQNNHKTNTKQSQNNHKTITNNHNMNKTNKFINKH